MPAMTLPSLTPAAPASASAAAARDTTAGAAGDPALDTASPGGAPQPSFGQQLKTAKSQQASGSRITDRANSPRASSAASSAATERSTSAAQAGTWSATAQRAGASPSTLGALLQSLGSDALEASRMRRGHGRLADMGNPRDTLAQADNADQAAAWDLAAVSGGTATTARARTGLGVDTPEARALVPADTDPQTTAAPAEVLSDTLSSTSAASGPSAHQARAKPDTGRQRESDTAAVLPPAAASAPLAAIAQKLQNVQDLTTEAKTPLDSIPAQTTEPRPELATVELPVNRLDPAGAQPAAVPGPKLSSTSIDLGLKADPAQLATSSTLAPGSPKGPAVAVAVTAAERAQEPARALATSALDFGPDAQASLTDAGLLIDGSPVSEPETVELTVDTADKNGTATPPVINLEPNAALLALMTPVPVAPAAPLPLPAMGNSVQATRSPAEQPLVQGVAPGLAAPAAPVAMATGAEASTQQGTPDDTRKPAAPPNFDNTNAAGSTTAPASAEAPIAPALPSAAASTHAAVAPTGDMAQATAVTAPSPTAQPDAVFRAAEQAMTGSATAPVEATIEAALDSAAFAPALGARIAVLARDGIEQARLNVHPADMGPITVQLALEGNQVRIDFSADMAGTRQTLEQAMPSLAASLRDAGFTLSGGGVSQQASQGQQQPGGQAQGAPATPAGGQSDELSPNAGTRPAARRETGLVDLFA